MARPKRVRFQAGERRAGEVTPSPPKATTYCVLCGCGVPLERFLEGYNYGVPTVPASEGTWPPWTPYPPTVSAKRRWPRKPTGERGFHWAPLTPQEVAAAFPDAPMELRVTQTLRMVEWLERCGVLPDGRGVRVTAVEAEPRGYPGGRRR